MGNSAFIILVALAKTYYLEVNIMNKTELIGALAAKTGMTRKDSEKALTAILDILDFHSQSKALNRMRLLYEHFSALSIRTTEQKTMPKKQNN